MTLQEFSIEFDLLYDNISSNQAPGLTEYEKSVFLTQAQDALILDLYKGTAGDSFESTEEVTRYLNTLVKSYTYDKNSMSHDIEYGVHKYELTLQPNTLFVILDYGIIRNKAAKVIATPHDKLLKNINNPFKQEIIRISEDSKIILYSKSSELTEYIVKYLITPTPIILKGALEEGLTIGGYTTSEMDCVLPEVLHRQILLRAVQMAKTVWQS